MNFRSPAVRRSARRVLRGIRAVEESGCSITSPTTTPKNHLSSQSLRSSAAGGRPADQRVRRRPHPMLLRSSTACPSKSRFRSRRLLRTGRSPRHRSSRTLPLKKTAKKAAAKRPAKKAVAKKTAESADSTEAKPARKRAAKKVAPAAEESVDEARSDVAVALEALTETVAEHSEPVSGARRSGTSEPDAPQLELPDSELPEAGLPEAELPEAGLPPRLSCQRSSPCLRPSSLRLRSLRKQSRSRRSRAEHRDGRDGRRRDWRRRFSPPPAPSRGSSTSSGRLR